MAVEFETFRQKHDPQGRLDWTFPFLLGSGESISTATVEVVDSASSAVDADAANDALRLAAEPATAAAASLLALSASARAASTSR